jgi:hypothetical protein
LYVLGGIEDGVKTASVLRFDSTQGTWSQVAPLREAYYGHTACAVGSDIYVFGGIGGQTSVFKFDTEADEWTTLAHMSRASAGHSVSVLDNLVYIVGAGDSHREVLRFDPVSDVWHTLASTLTIQKHGASFVLGGCLYAAGGSRTQPPSVERYDVASNTWAVAANMLEGRGYFAAVKIGSTGPAEE